MTVIPSQKLRARMERAVERLLAALDRLDALAEDLEPEDDEEHDGREPDVDDEPSLAATNWRGLRGDRPGSGCDQRGWCSGSDRDLEENGDEEDGEPGAPDEAVFPPKSISDRPAAALEAEKLASIERRKFQPAPRRDPDEVVLLDETCALWGGPRRG